MVGFFHHLSTNPSRLLLLTPPHTCGASGALGGKNAGRGGGAVIAGPLGTAGAATA